MARVRPSSGERGFDLHERHADGEARTSRGDMRRGGERHTHHGAARMGKGSRFPAPRRVAAASSIRGASYEGAGRFPPGTRLCGRSSHREWGLHRVRRGGRVEEGERGAGGSIAEKAVCEKEPRPTISRRGSFFGSGGVYRGRRERGPRLRRRPGRGRV
jgi:hypothetical protein